MGFSLRIAFTDILQNDSLENVYMNGFIIGYRFKVRLGYYRGHYLSVIDKLAVEVDRREVPEENILFCLNGKEFEPVELRHQVSEFWDIVEPAAIRVFAPGGLEAGEHTVKLTLLLRCPYLPQPGSTQPHHYVPIDSSDEQVLCLINGGLHA